MAAMLAAALAGCSTADSGPVGPHGRWLVTGIAGQPAVAPAQTTFELAEDGTVSGKGACNNYFGAAEVAGEAITFGPFGATSMACETEIMDQEGAFFAAMAGVAAWRIEGEQLVLLDQAGAEAVRMNAMDETAAIVIDVPGAAGAVATQQVAYDCGGLTIEVEYIDAGDVSLATLAIGEEFVVASRVLAASGARYTGEQYVWWTKGDEATLVDYKNGGADNPVACMRAG
jgi:heat shock protein HslJ